MTRLQKILAGLLAVQIALAVLVFWPHGRVQAAGEPLLSDLKPESVTAVTLTDDQGNTVKLARQDSGWVLASGGDYPVTAASVTGLLGKLTAVKTDRLVTQTPGSLNRLQIADDNFVRRLDISTDDGRTLTVYLGSTANFRATHVRLAGQDAVYLADDLTTRDASATPGDWIDSTYVNVPAGDMTAVTVQNQNGAFTFNKSATGEWTYADLAEGETYNPARFNTILSRLSNLTMIAPLGTTAEASYQLDAPLATVTVMTQDDSGEQSNTLLIGAQDADSGNYVAKWSGSDYYVNVNSFSANDIVTLTRDDLLTTAATTTPAPAP
ncbi:MAG: DUF4340 domain-containing protein [Anaerolineales bacterium]|nr:DUF4340 domain-containing protein [Anaerolineales bacterium]